MKTVMRFAQQPVVDLGVVAADGSRCLQRLDAPRGRRGREAHSLAYLIIGRTAMALQVAQNRSIQFVKTVAGFGRRHFRADLHSFRA